MVSDPPARTPLALVEDALRRLGAPPNPVTIDTTELGLTGAQHATLTVLQVRDLLGRPDTPVEVKNRGWALLIRRAHHDDPIWRLVAIGVALPRLRRLAAELRPDDPGARAELEAEIVAGFLTALAQARTSGQRRFPALIDATRRAGLAWLTRCRLAAPAHADIPEHLAARPTTSATTMLVSGVAGHPDLVLADAVATGVLTRDEAELIAATRIEDHPLRRLAAAQGVPAKSLWMRRDRAEARLITALSATSGPEDTGRTEHRHHAHQPAHQPATTPLTEQLDHPARSHPHNAHPDNGHGERSGRQVGHPALRRTEPLPARTGTPPRSTAGHAPGAVASGAAARAFPRRPTAGRVPTRCARAPLPPLVVLLTLLLTAVWAGAASSPRQGANEPAPLSAAIPTAAIPTARVTALVSGRQRDPLPERWPGRATRRAGGGRGVLAQAGTDGTAQLTRVLNNIRTWLMGLLITLATLILTVGGVRYLLAGGDPGEVEAAKRAVKSAAIGYALAALAPALVAILHTLIGV